MMINDKKLGPQPTNKNKKCKGAVYKLYIKTLSHIFITNLVISTERGQLNRASFYLVQGKLKKKKTFTEFPYPSKISLPSWRMATFLNHFF